MCFVNAIRTIYRRPRSITLITLSVLLRRSLPFVITVTTCGFAGNTFSQGPSLSYAVNDP